MAEFAAASPRRIQGPSERVWGSWAIVLIGYYLTAVTSRQWQAFLFLQALHTRTLPAVQASAGPRSSVAVTQPHVKVYEPHVMAVAPARNTRTHPYLRRTEHDPETLLPVSLGGHSLLALDIPNPSVQNNDVEPKLCWTHHVMTRRFYRATGVRTEAMKSRVDKKYRNE